jgi:hypothetical protein
MKRPVVQQLQRLSMGLAMATAAAISLALTACSSDVPSKTRLDSGIDGTRVDVVDTGTDRGGGGPDLTTDRADGGSDQRETGTDTTTDLPKDGAGDTNRSDVRSDATDLPPPSDATDATDLAIDVGVDQSPETGGNTTEVGPDSPPDSPAPDAPPGDDGSPPDSSPGPACGDGCPLTVQPADLVLWLSADYGVTCDSARISDWRDRANTARSFKPVTGKLGPACGTATLATKPVATFDRAGTTDTDAVLPIDLTPMVNNSYTIFVVERRRVAAEGYLLGTSAIGACDATPYLSYKFGYTSSTEFFAGVLGYDDQLMDCDDVKTPVSATPQAVVDVEWFSKTAGHVLYMGSDLKGMNTDPAPLVSLPDNGYLGRAFQRALGESRFQGDIAEVVIYKAALSDLDRGAVTGYLTARWLQ